MASTEPHKPLRADARRNRERIVDAARELFAECGAGTQMDDVARRAQVGVGTVYRHFPTKQALLGELLAAKFRGHAEIARRWSDEPDGWAAFEGFLRETFAQIAQDATLQQRVHWVDDDEALAIADAERNVVVALLGEIIARAQAQGRMRADVHRRRHPGDHVRGRRGDGDAPPSRDARRRASSSCSSTACAP